MVVGSNMSTGLLVIRCLAMAEQGQLVSVELHVNVPCVSV